ncbi:MAG TPA: aldo/keto reductase [Rariglobus sp.]|jgi:aryl-alcohol dehydrogenase-like predicted oxidoreductase|nr:aldo/keto reductase [Rariglobus sp.]
MKRINFFPWTDDSSVLGYGTTSFMSADSTKERLALLAAAFDQGINHFDTAAYYGYGEAERLLGKFLVGKRDKVTVTTKFGIEPTGIVKLRWANLLVRKAFKVIPSLRKIVVRRPGVAAVSNVFDPIKAEQSLDRSLTALRTDYVDLFLLHEPSLESVASGSLMEYLEREIGRGRIRAFGCGGAETVLEVVAKKNLSSGRWLQFEDNVIHKRIESIAGGDRRCITYAPFNSSLKMVMTWLRAEPARILAWSKQLDIDCSLADNIAALLQATSHGRNASGIVLFSTRKVEHIKSAVKVASGNYVTNDQCDKFIKLTAAIRW